MGRSKNAFINAKQGFLEELDVFEEVKEDWSEADGQKPFTGCIHSAMALQVLGSWEPLPSEINEAIGGMAGEPWEVLPQTRTPVAYQLRVPSFVPLENIFIMTQRKRS